ncbi:apolipoprotein D-like [Ostrea edulis]|uniref:apolipoprotein D-like n=1 Tax=Ostrea edulis TaxID=37623 RepID=UPI0024AFD1B9|nr:apolipoprotein D-like [Ostrea edulis]
MKTGQFVCLLFCLGYVSAQVFKFGSCPNVPVQSDFDLDRYYGTWYEFERYFFIAESLLKCSSATYSSKPDGTIQVVNSGVNFITGRDSSVTGTASVDPKFNNTAKLTVGFGGFSNGPYWVLKTDYDQYVIVFSCTNILFGRAHTEIMWILTRERTGITEEMKNDLHRYIRQVGLDPSKLSPTQQTNCS